MLRWILVFVKAVLALVASLVGALSAFGSDAALDAARLL